MSGAGKVVGERKKLPSGGEIVVTKTADGRKAWAVFSPSGVKVAEMAAPSKGAVKFADAIRSALERTVRDPEFQRLAKQRVTDNIEAKREDDEEAPVKKARRIAVSRIEAAVTSAINRVPTRCYQHSIGFVLDRKGKMANFTGATGCPCIEWAR